jgi:hypothetical protein
VNTGLPGLRCGRLAGRHRAAAIPREPWSKADHEM